MIRIRSLEIAGFRGSLAPLSVDFANDRKSIAIFGDNASGKSSLTDAIEWFYWNRVEHLWRENCKEGALRHVLLKENEAAHVEIHFSDPALNCKKSISHALSVSQSNKSAAFTAYLSQVQNGHEQIALRNFDILSFVLEPKAQKRQRLEKIIGYEALNEFREIIGKTLYQLERTAEYTTAKANKQEYQKEIFQIARTVIATENELFRAAEEIAATVGFVATVTNKESYAATVDQLKSRIHDKDRAAKKLALSNCAAYCESFAQKLKQVPDKIEEFSGAYSQLIASEEEIRQIRLSAFLSSGSKAIVDQLVPPDTCPLCLQAIPWGTLRALLETRIIALEESKRKYDKAVAAKNALQSKLSEAVASSGAFTKSAEKADLDEACVRPAIEYAAEAKQLDQAIAEGFKEYKPLTIEIEPYARAAAESTDHALAALRAQVAAVELSTEEQKLLDVIQKLDNLSDRFHKFQKASNSVKEFEAQIQTLSKIKDRFSALHATALQNALDKMSKDISRYYLEMHPKEDVDEVKLKVIEDGVEFQYKFHEETVYPPLKYLSESHLNSIGIAAFLASAKHFNRINNFFVLDDVVTSFDANHRIRILRLIKDEFSNWQLIVLTHERFWFEMIKRELVPAGWLVAEFASPVGLAVQMKSSPRSNKEQIVEKKNSGNMTPNDLRIAFERMLQSLGVQLEIQVALRYNDDNEKRMIGELLDGLKARLRKKSPATLLHPAVSQVEVCGLVVNAGSHTSDALLSAGDLDASFDDIVNFDGLFFCDRCSTYVSVQNVVAHERRVYCRCGQKYLDWKD